MAGSGGTALALLPRKRRGKNPGKTASGSAVRERWEVHFSRFFCYHPAHSTCPDLVPPSTRIRNLSTAGNWVSSCSSLAMLHPQLAHDHSSDDVLLTGCFAGKVIEEHYVSKLQYVWPHVSCNPRLPSKSTRAVLVSYRDCVGEVQKFALRFLSVDEAERFMISLKGLYTLYLRFRLIPLKYCQASAMQMSTHYSYAHQMMHIHNFQQNFPAVRPAQSTVSESINLNSRIMPPSFTSLLVNSQPVFEQAQSFVSHEVISPEANLISRIASYRGDTSFQDMLSNMGRVISEMGVDMTL